VPVYANDSAMLAVLQGLTITSDTNSINSSLVFLNTLAGVTPSQNNSQFIFSQLSGLVTTAIQNLYSYDDPIEVIQDYISVKVFVDNYDYLVGEAITLDIGTNDSLVPTFILPSNVSGLNNTNIGVAYNLFRKFNPFPLNSSSLNYTYVWLLLNTFRILIISL
jgi:hypothetical protein